MTARVTALLIAFSLDSTPQSPSPQATNTARREIQAAYAKALDAMRNAKSLEDLDEIDRSFDTLDWQSLAPGQPRARGWQELRKYGFEGLWAPFQSAELIIDTFETSGDTAVFTGKIRQIGMKGNVSLIAVKETWKKTVMGWKRQVHQKFPPGETPK